MNQKKCDSERESHHCTINKFEPLRLCRVVKVAGLVDDEKGGRVWRKHVQLGADEDLIDTADGHRIKLVVAKRTGQRPALVSVAVNER